MKRKTIKKCLFSLIAGSITPLMSNTSSNAYEVFCDKGENIDLNSMTRIIDDLYISEDGKIYEKTDCVYFPDFTENHLKNFIEQFNLQEKGSLFLAIPLESSQDMDSENQKDDSLDFSIIGRGGQPSVDKDNEITSSITLQDNNSVDQTIGGNNNCPIQISGSSNSVNCSTSNIDNIESQGNIDSISGRINKTQQYNENNGSDSFGNDDTVDLPTRISDWGSIPTRASESQSMRLDSIIRDPVIKDSTFGRGNSGSITNRKNSRVNLNDYFGSPVQRDLNVFRGSDDNNVQNFFRILDTNSQNTTKESNSTIEIQSPGQIEISPVVNTKFYELDRQLSIDELISLKRYILGEIDNRLREKYNSKYELIENNDTILRAKVNHLNREVTQSNWETLELTITPILATSQTIDMSVSAILFVKSGLQVSIPSKSGYKPSDDYTSLEEYVLKLIGYLKDEFPFAEFSY